MPHPRVLTVEVILTIGKLWMKKNPPGGPEWPTIEDDDGIST